MEVLLLTIVSVLVGYGLGIFVSSMKNRRQTDGILKCAQADSDGPYLFLQLLIDINDLCNKKYATFKVDAKKYISRD